ncbi:MAG: hypothetical protein FWE05_09870 [Defluviitaleaceae bacterium]|nr:hypothetical protein [Defluviitaleaceae bacterium]
MLELILISFRIRFIVMTNRIIHFLKRLPLIKRLVSPNIYRGKGLKIFFTILGMIFVMSKKSLIHLLYVAFLIVLGMTLNQLAIHGGFVQIFDLAHPLVGMDALGVVGYALLLWVGFSFLASPLASITVSASNHANDNKMINCFRANPTRYAISRIVVDRFAEVILYFPWLLIAFLILPTPFPFPLMNLWATIGTLIVFTSVRLLAEVLNLWMFKNTGKHFGDTVIAYSASLIYIVVLLVLHFFDISSTLSFFTNWVFFQPIAWLLFLGIGCLAIMYIKKYPFHMKLWVEKLQRHEAAYAQARTAMGAKAEMTTAKKWSEGVSFGDLKTDKHKNKSGFAYLNAIFFDRHRRFFNKKMFTRLVIMFVPLVVAGVATLYSRIAGIDLPLFIFGEDGLIGEDYGLDWIFTNTPIFLFILYMASMGRMVTASAFTNCDIHMLHYQYYRTARTILASFKARFFVILRYNLLVTSVASLSVLGAMTLIYGSMDLVYAVLFFVALTFMGVFYAFNDLFLYYVIQPYDAEGKSQSVPYKVIDWVIYLVIIMTYANIQVRLLSFAAFLVGITIVYVGVGLVLLVKFAPRQFKLR